MAKVPLIHLKKNVKTSNIKQAWLFSTVFNGTVFVKLLKGLGLNLIQTGSLNLESEFNNLEQNSGIKLNFTRGENYDKHIYVLFPRQFKNFIFGRKAGH